MLYAYVHGEKIEATRERRRAICGTCEHEVIAKCGELKIWHWAHKAKDCDPWSEPETAWHKNWKELFPREWREVRMGKHRCDIRTPRYVIELQHSYLRPVEISEREQFYGDMIWIFDLRACADRVELPPLPQLYGHLQWPRFRKTVALCKKPVFAHLKPGVLLNIFDYNTPYMSYRRFTKDEFLTSVGAPCENPSTPMTIEAFTSVAVQKVNTECERKWREHLLRTQPWLKDKI